jgi:hypothetical protein
MFVTIHLPERGGINEVHMALHQFGEGVLGICPGKLAEQFLIGRHFQVIAPAEIKTAQEKIGFDMKASVRQRMRELTARFPPLFWDKSRSLRR